MWSVEPHRKSPLKFSEALPIIYSQGPTRRLALGGAGRLPRKSSRKENTMRINTNVSAVNTHRVLTQTNEAVAGSIGRLPSGYKINSARDNAAGLAIANRFRADIRSLQVAQQNTTEANSMLQVAEGNASTIGDILTRMKELATQAASYNADSQTDKLQQEFDYLVEEIDRIVGSAKYQGVALLDGQFSGTFQIGATDDANDRLEIGLDQSLEADALGVDGLSLDSGSGAQAALQVLDSAIDTVSEFLGTIGATQNRLEYASNNIATTIENYSASESAIRDADMAYEMVHFTRNQIMQQASTAMLAQANFMPQSVLQLLG